LVGVVGSRFEDLFDRAFDRVLNRLLEISEFLADVADSLEVLLDVADLIRRDLVLDGSPMDRPICGIFRGPKSSSATTKIKISSGMPRVPNTGPPRGSIPTFEFGIRNSEFPPTRPR
jgi:hypothetical protein